MLLCIPFLGHPSVKPHHLQVPAPRAGLCWQHHVGMHRDSGRLTTNSLEEALVLLWLLSVFLQCLGQPSRLPAGVFPLVCLTKALVPALVPRLSAGPRMVVPVNLSSRESEHQVSAARCRWGTAKTPGLPVLSALQNGARDKEGVIKALIMELCPFSSWLSQAELCSPAQLC